MREYWLAEFLLRAVGWSYLLVAALFLALALWLPKRWTHKVFAAFAVVALAVAIPLALVLPGMRERAERAERQEAQQRRADAMFRELCKRAGEKIYRTVDNVQGIRLMNVRPVSSPESKLAPNPMIEFGGDSYIRSFLVYEQPRQRPDAPRHLLLNSSTSTLPGYRWVEARKPGDTQWYRYWIDPPYELKREEIAAPSARYGVTYEEPVVAAERELRIARSTIRVMDLETAELLAESVRFVMAPGQGDSIPERILWGFPRRCEGHGRYSETYTRFFVDQVLKPPHREGA